MKVIKKEEKEKKVVPMPEKTENVNNLIRPQIKKIWPFEGKDFKGLPLIYWLGGNVYWAKGYQDFSQVLSIIAQLGLTIIGVSAVHGRTYVFTHEIRNWNSIIDKKQV